MRRQPSFTRADRLEHLMTDEVERLLAYEVRSPLARLVKVVHAHLSPDLGHLRVNYVMLDGTEARAEVQAVLEQAGTFVGRTVAESMQLRKRPQVAFHFDRDAMRSQRVEELLREEAARRAPLTDGAPENAAAADVAPAVVAPEDVAPEDDAAAAESESADDDDAT